MIGNGLFSMRRPRGMEIKNRKPRRGTISADPRPNTSLAADPQGRGVAAPCRCIRLSYPESRDAKHIDRQRRDRSDVLRAMHRGNAVAALGEGGDFATCQPDGDDDAWQQFRCESGPETKIMRPNSSLAGGAARSVAGDGRGSILLSAHLSRRVMGGDRRGTRRCRAHPGTPHVLPPAHTALRTLGMRMACPGSLACRQTTQQLDAFSSRCGLDRS